MRAAPTFAILAVFALAVLAAPARAQASPHACLSPILDFSPTPAKIRAGETFILLVTIQNPNPASAASSVTAQVSTTAPGGWSVTPAQTTVAIDPTSVAFDSLTLVAPSAGTGAAAGNVSVLVKFQCHSTTGLEPTSVSTKMFHVAVDETQTPWLEVGAFVLAIALVVLAWVMLRGRGGGVSAFAEVRQKDAPPGKGVSFPIVVQNRRREPNSIRLAVDPVPVGWSAFVALSEIDLDAKEQRSLWLMVKPPADAKVGETVEVVVSLTSEYFPEDESTLRVRATVAAGSRKSERAG